MIVGRMISQDRSQVAGRKDVGGFFPRISRRAGRDGEESAQRRAKPRNTRMTRKKRRARRGNGGSRGKTEKRVTRDARGRKDEKRRWRSFPRSPSSFSRPICVNLWESVDEVLVLSVPIRAIRGYRLLLVLSAPLSPLVLPGVLVRRAQARSGLP